MPPSIDVLADCRFQTKAAIDDPPDSRCRGVADAHAAPHANPNRRFPRPGADAGDAAPEAPCATVGASFDQADRAPPAAAEGAPVAAVARDAANVAAGPGGGVDPPISATPPAVPTAVSHRGTPPEMDGARSGARTPFPGNGNRTSRDVDGGKRRHFPWGRSVAADGSWVVHERCVRCGATTRKHVSHGLCVRCYSRTWRGEHPRRERTPEETARDLERRRRLLVDPGPEGEWYRAQRAANHKRRQDRASGLIPDYSPVACLVTWRLFDGRCAKCGIDSDLSIDHHRPRAAGVALSPGNAVLLCRWCNTRKGSKQPERFYPPDRLWDIEIKLLFAPILVQAIDRILLVYRAVDGRRTP